jgi:tetratricopeptide (TPR) repeat protein
MDIKSILESLERTDSIWELLTLTPIVGPGAIISNNLEWSSRFSEGRAAFYNGKYAQAAQIFRELNKDIPRHDKFLTPARINETLCWPRLGRFAEYVQQYEPLVTQNKVYGGVALWTLVVGYCRTDNTIDAEACLKKWLEYPASQHLGKGYLRGLLQTCHLKARRL